MNPVSIDHLPKAMQKRPEVRALTLRVYRGEGASHFRVPGGSDIYNVYAIENTFHCSCKAGLRGANCAHIYAVQHFLKQENP